VQAAPSQQRFLLHSSASFTAALPAAAASPVLVLL